MVKEFAKDYLAELASVMEKLSLDDFNKAVDIIYGTYMNRQSIFTMGNGGSASTASHFICDINKGLVNCSKNRFRMFCLNDSIPTMLAYANDQSYDDIFVEQLANLLNPSDLVIGISGSGNSPNVIKAIKYAKENSATSIGFTGFDGGELAKIADLSIIVPANDMQKVEDMHLILTHIIMQTLENLLKQTANG